MSQLMGASEALQCPEHARADAP
eukprot:SAG25_NODE_13602_length_265_cov_0.626506_1_plen_22_part_01